MSKPRNHRWSLRSLERQVAPHIDPGWAEAMLLELRLLGVGGSRIGAVLAEIDSHCADSGQTAEEAFGDPVDYAKGLELPAEDDVSPRALAWSAAPILVQVLGMLVLLPSITAWRAGDPARFSEGMLVSIVMLPLLVAASIGRIDLLLRTAVQHPLVAWAVNMVPLVLFVAAPLLLPINVLQVPATWAIALALLLLVVGTTWGFLWQHNQPLNEVVAPLPPSTYRSSAPGVVRVLTTGLVPLATAGLLAMTWWMNP